MKIRKITQLLVLDAIEPLLPAWKDALGFAVLVEVPELASGHVIALAQHD